MQVAYTAKDQFTAFVGDLTEKLKPDTAAVDDAYNAVLEVARTSQVSLLQILAGKPNFYMNASLPRKSLLVPDDLVKFPVKMAQMAYETLSGIPMRFVLSYV